MIKFFRRIRLSLLTDNLPVGGTGKFRKYLLYAVGEIFLVVIGILIALQINNWNEAEKDKRKAITTLEAIRSDLVLDLEEMKDLKVSWGERLAYFQKVYPSFKPNIELASENIDVKKEIEYWTLFGLGRPFRANTSSFDAMINEGNYALIANKKLLSDIQEYYTFYVAANEDAFNILRLRQSELTNKYAHLLTYKPYKYLSEIIDEYMIADLNIYFGALNFYSQVSFIRNPIFVEEVIAQIDKELDH